MFLNLSSKCSFWILYIYVYIYIFPIYVNTVQKYMLNKKKINKTTQKENFFLLSLLLFWAYPNNVFYIKFNKIWK